MDILDGKIVKEEKLKELKKKIDILNEEISLVVIQVGNDKASNVYIKQKEDMAKKLNFKFKHIKFAEDVLEEEIIKTIDELNNNKKVDGILVQMPLPKHLDSKKIQNEVSPDKDVDGLTDINMGRLVHNRKALIACTPMGIIDLLDFYKIEIEGKNIVIVGRSDLVGKPLASLFTNKNATVTLCHSKTKNLKEITKNADILVVAVGTPNLINKDYIKDHAVVIDVGINRLENNTLCGDVDFDDVKEKTSFITPVPGGVGQMTVYELGYNTYKAHMMRK